MKPAGAEAFAQREMNRISSICINFPRLLPENSDKANGMEARSDVPSSPLGVFLGVKSSVF